MIFITTEFLNKASNCPAVNN